MARRKKGNRALGPYYQAKRDRWQVVRIAVDCKTGVEDTKPFYFKDEEEASTFKKMLDEENPESKEGIVRYAIDQYEVAKRKPGRRSMATCIPRLNTFFNGMKGYHLAHLSIERLVQRLENRGETRKKECQKKCITESYESLISEVRDVRVFVRWCGHSKRRWVSQELMERLAELSVGEFVDNLERQTGKKQLTFDEATTYLQYGLKLLRGEVKAPKFSGFKDPCNLKGHQGPLVALLPLTSGIDGQEIFGRVVRDLDQGGAKLIVRGGKTQHRNVPIPIPEELRQPLLDLAKGKKPDDLLFPSRARGKHPNSYGAEWVVRLCGWAGVPVVCPHGLRGTAATVAAHYGVGGAESVARFLRHADRGETAERHYIGKERVRATAAERGFQLVTGGLEQVG